MAGKAYSVARIMGGIVGRGDMRQANRKHQSGTDKQANETRLDALRN